MNSPLSRFARSATLVTVVGAALATSAEAQVDRRVERPVEDLLAAFVGDPGAPARARGELNHVISKSDAHPRAYLEALLQGLEEIAIAGDSSLLSARAAWMVSRPGSRSRANPVRGTFARLERIVRQSSDPVARRVAVSGMADLEERAEALAFLEQMAVQKPTDGRYLGSPGMALSTIVAMGDEGRALLQRLHETGAVSDPEARHSLSVLASLGYRIYQ